MHDAALCPPVDTLTLTDDDLEATLAVNVRAPHVLTAALAPAMVERGHGSIVVIGSWMAHVGHAFVGLYSATKAAEPRRCAPGRPSSGRAGCGSTPSRPAPPARRSTTTPRTSSCG
ncbi:hypothetical protein GCM10025868_15990 [Angustibacter aerolatus]|uniref:Uncharacterized protein n=1 Tax=Angustibacter aerolatus TaxID=1162965 RepID=A0ABQ6JG31_9ACTN|nr:hypothetical protein GCM10025868_15990 [Angustibacter aerolatus]